MKRKAKVDAKSQKQALVSSEFRQERIYRKISQAFEIIQNKLHHLSRNPENTAILQEIFGLDNFERMEPTHGKNTKRSAIKSKNTKKNKKINKSEDKFVHSVIVFTLIPHIIKGLETRYRKEKKIQALDDSCFDLKEDVETLGPDDSKENLIFDYDSTDGIEQMINPNLKITVDSLALDNILFQDQLRALCKEEDEENFSLKGVFQKFKLFKFIAMMCPCNRDDKSLIHFLTSKKLAITINLLTQDIYNVMEDLSPYYHWLYSHKMIDENSYLEIRQFYSRTSNRSVTLKNKITQTNKNLSKKLLNLQAKLNKNSIFYIKTKLEELYHIVWPPDKMSDYQHVKTLAEEICTCMKSSLNFCIETVGNKEADYGMDDEEEMEIALNILEVKLLLTEEKLDPLKIWREISLAYSSYARKLKMVLESELTLGTNIEIESFVNTILLFPSSFIASKKILKVNWERVFALMDIYEGLTKNKNNADELPKINILTADLQFNYQINDQPSEKIIMPIHLLDSIEDKELHNNNIQELSVPIETLEELQNLNNDFQVAEVKLLDLIQKNLSKLILPKINLLKNGLLTGAEINIYSQYFYEKPEVDDLLNNLNIKIRELLYENSISFDAGLVRNYSFEEKNNIGLGKITEWDCLMDDNVMEDDNSNENQVGTDSTQRRFLYEPQFFERILCSSKISLPKRAYFFTSMSSKRTENEGLLLLSCEKMSESQKKINEALPPKAGTLRLD